MPAQGGVVSSAQQPSPDLAVVGGGVIGLAVAWSAARRGLRTLVLEREHAGAGASGVAAGMLAPVSEATFGERDLLALNLESGRRWPAFARELAAAAGGRPGLPDAGRFPTRRVRGQLLRLRARGGAGLLDRVLRTEDVYVVPRGDGRYVLGATVEEQGFDETVTAGALHDLLRDAIEVLPGIAELELQDASAGLRPGTPDNAPVIGRGALDGLHWA